MINAIDAQSWLVAARQDTVNLDYINQVILANVATSSPRTTVLTAITLAINEINAMTVEVELFLGNTVTLPTYTTSTHLFTGVVPVYAGTVTYVTDTALLTAAGNAIAEMEARYTAQVNYLIASDNPPGSTYGGTVAKSSNYTTAQTALIGGTCLSGTAALVVALP
jgi:hypothetical protein